MYFDERGFNLFTALVSFLLIILAVLLVSSMMQSEKKASETIAGIEARSDLEAVAQMARADAMQLFNYALRYTIEDWLTTGSMTLELENKTWDEIQRDFASSRFGGDGSKQLAFFTAKTLVGLFHGETHFGNYRITFEESDTLQQGLETAIQKSVDTGEFFTVIECKEGDPKNCPKGTFYVNLHLDKLSQEEYESLPKLEVYDKTTGKELKLIILPKTTFRIYVPLRFFKAIAEARALTHYPVDPATIDTAADYGLFSPRVHNTIEDMALGMCDYGYCAPRNDPFKPPASKSLVGTNICPGYSSGELGLYWEQGVQTNLECPYTWCASILLRNPQYNANNDDGGKSMKTVLEEVAGAKVCDVMQKARLAGYLDVDPDDQFSLIGSKCDDMAESIEVGVAALESKKIGEAESGSASIIPGFSGGGYDAEECGRNNMFNLPEGRRVGLFRDGEGNVVDPNISSVELPCSGDFGNFQSLCTEVTSVRVTLAFKEENPIYMVDKEGDKIYKILLMDNTYIPFTANWDSGNLGSDCVYGEEAIERGCSLNSNQGWNCKTMYTTGGGGVLSGPSATGSAFTPTGCVPA